MAGQMYRRRRRGVMRVLAWFVRGLRIMMLALAGIGGPAPPPPPLYRSAPTEQREETRASASRQ